ncbi:hypothetical protein [Thiocapsa sp.]|uniref:hypothetical protein n=1 Tax=Thiocapsa sp. TaxID=2024551 RepID=UPI0035930F8C
MKIKRCFGYGLHLLADTRQEIPVAFSLTPASVSEQPTLRAMTRATFTETPELAARCRDLTVFRPVASSSPVRRLPGYALRAGKNRSSTNVSRSRRLGFPIRYGTLVQC